MESAIDDINDCVKSTNELGVTHLLTVCCNKPLRWIIPKLVDDPDPPWSVGPTPRHFDSSALITPTNRCGSRPKALIGRIHQRGMKALDRLRSESTMQPAVATLDVKT